MPDLTPETLDDVIEDYEEILECMRHGRPPSHCAAMVIDTTDALISLSSVFLGARLSESRDRIRRAIVLGEECSVQTDTIERNLRLFWDLRQRAEIFD